MDIKFIRGYAPYLEGQITRRPNEIAIKLINAGYAVEYIPPAPSAPPVPEKRPNGTFKSRKVVK